MKRIILITIFILVAFSSFAQRLNEHGLKMVSEIEYTDNYRNTVYQFKFKYDDHDRLMRMTIYRKWIDTEVSLKYMKSLTPQERKEYMEEFPSEFKLYRDFIKTSDGLTVKDYDYFNYSPLRWEVTFDCYDHITKICEYEEFDIGAIVRHEYQYFYERDGDTFKVSRSSFTESFKRKGQKSWRDSSVGTIGSNSFPSKKNKDDNIDYEHINDTNINLTRLSSFGCFYFPLTEWIPCGNKYFEKAFYHNPSENLYHYNYDAQGNLIEIKHVPDIVRQKITIKYLY